MENKYQKALDNVSMRPLIRCHVISENKKSDLNLALLQELVDREIPKKPVKRYYVTRYGNNGHKKRLDIRCSNCNSAFTNGARTSVGVFSENEVDFLETVNNQKFCMFCGQRIDWSDLDEKDNR